MNPVNVKSINPECFLLQMNSEEQLYILDWVLWIINPSDQSLIIYPPETILQSRLYIGDKATKGKDKIWEKDTISRQQIFGNHLWCSNYIFMIFFALDLFIFQVNG